MSTVRSLARGAIFSIALSVCAMSTGCLGTTDLPDEAQIETTDFASSLGVDLAHSVKLESGVVIRDITIGSGVPLASPDSVFVHYSGFLSNGAKFDENVSPDDPYRFKLGNNEVIPGFESGVLGMQVGGTRQIIIPPRLGYGFAGAPPRVPGNTVIVFNVELVARK